LPAQPGKARSMEDIMADIRRAVTDEQAGKMALRTAETRQATAEIPRPGCSRVKPPPQSAPRSAR
jgi:hypothetical protein